LRRSASNAQRTRLRTHPITAARTTHHRALDRRITPAKALRRYSSDAVPSRPSATSSARDSSAIHSSTPGASSTSSSCSSSASLTVPPQVGAAADPAHLRVRITRPSASANAGAMALATRPIIPASQSSPSRALPAQCSPCNEHNEHTRTRSGGCRTRGTSTLSASADPTRSRARSSPLCLSSSPSGPRWRCRWRASRPRLGGRRLRSGSGVAWPKSRCIGV